ARRRTAASADLLGEAEELAPGLIDGVGIASVRVILLGDVAVVVDAGDGQHIDEKCNGALRLRRGARVCRGCAAGGVGAKRRGMSARYAREALPRDAALRICRRCTRPCPRAKRAIPCGNAAPQSIGSTSVNADPFPGSESTSIRPPSNSAKPREMYSPSPVPPCRR